MASNKIVSAPKWAHLDLNQVPDIKVTPPGPKSKELHTRCTKYFKGLSGQVKLFPVTFETFNRPLFISRDSVLQLSRAYLHTSDVLSQSKGSPMLFSFLHISIFYSYLFLLIKTMVWYLPRHGFLCF